MNVNFFISQNTVLFVCFRVSNVRFSITGQYANRNFYFQCTQPVLIAINPNIFLWIKRDKSPSGRLNFQCICMYLRIIPSSVWICRELSMLHATIFNDIRAQE